MHFFAELKRRNVFKVGAAYLVVAWLLLQMTAILLPLFAAPVWIQRVFVLLLAVGFVVALFIAWAFELTPEGIKPTLEVDSDSSIRAQTGQKLNYLIMTVLAVVIVLMALDNYVLDADSSAADIATKAIASSMPVANAEPQQATAQVAEKSVAVLPFTNLSADSEQEYFSDGLTEELLNQLAQVQGLQVAGRISWFTFKGSDASLQTIGAALGVAHILNGSVRKSGNQLRITAELVKAADGYQLWSGAYNRELTDVFVIQDEIAEAVTTALSITIGAGDFGRPGMTRNIEAYDAYLQSISFYRIFSGATDLRNAIDQIERAVALDPDFSQAWFLLTDIYQNSGQFLTAEQRKDFPARIAEARARIRAVTPDLPELQLVLAQELIAESRLVDAKRVLLNHLDTKGASSASAAIAYGSLLARVGQRQEALRYFQQARRLEPLDLVASWNLMQALMTLGRYDETFAEIDRGLTLQGLEQYISGQRFLLELQRNDPEAALTALNRMEQTQQFNYTLVNLWIAGNKEAALEEVRRIVMRPGVAGATFTLMSQWATVLGDPQLALDIRNGGGEVAGITGPRRDVSGLWLPYASDMRKLPGFKQWAQELGLVDYWRSTGNWADLCRPVNDDFECE
jgi:TolB-like protein/Flp pilus assembly protein TadD